MKKNNNLERLELRSEKVRNIMGSEPSWIVRYGTVLIAVLLGLIFFVARLIGFL